MEHLKLRYQFCLHLLDSRQLITMRMRKRLHYITALVNTRTRSRRAAPGPGTACNAGIVQLCCAMIQRLSATGMRPTTARVMLRRIRTVHSASSAVCGRHFYTQSGTPASPLHHVACSEKFLPSSSLSAVQIQCYSSPAQKLSSTERIKVVLREYGVVAVVFHTVMSLGSLGTCYLIVSR